MTQGGFMRAKFSFFVILATAAFLTLGLGAANLHAAQYLGEVTWQGPNPTGGTFTLTGGLSRMGGAYYTIQGRGADAGRSLIFSGGGVVVGNDLKLVVTMVGENDNEVLTWRIVVDKTTLNGNFLRVSMLSYVPLDKLDSLSDPLPDPYSPGSTIKSHMAGPLGNLPDTGTLTRTSPPLVIESTVVPTLPLLLDNR
jgi:hypothetical protein